jgi:hypothetical protein
MFCVMYIFYFEQTLPSFPNNPRLNNLLCVLSEINWSMLKYLRSYSILLIALYRFLAVFYLTLFKKLNSSLIWLILPLLVLWLFSAIIFVSTKFGFQTTYGSLYCIDGFTTYLPNAIGYLTVTTIISLILPFLCITIIYYLIKKNSNANEKKINFETCNGEGTRRTTIEPSLTLGGFFGRRFTQGSSQMDANKSIKIKKQELNKTKRLNRQLIALNICYLLSFSVAFVLNFRYIIADFNTRFYFWRQILRILNVFFQSLIPIVSLYFNRNINSFVKRLFRKHKLHPNVQ